MFIKSMKTIFTILNSLAIAWAVYLVVVDGQTMQAIDIIVFGMALGSIHGSQKKSFHLTTFILNVCYLLFGVIACINVISLGKPLSQILHWFLPMVVIFLVIPSYNSKYAFHKIKS